MFDFLSNKFSTIFSRITGSGVLTEKNVKQSLDQVHDSLVEADVPQEIAKEFIELIKSEALGKKVLSSVKPGEQFIKIVHAKLRDFLGGQRSITSFKIPSIIMVMGLQGSGKTTSLAKIAAFITKEAKKKGKKHKILLASVDFYRPAAVEQLKVLAEQEGFEFYVSSCENPVEAAVDIHKYSKANQCDYLLLDTAGRLHVDSQMLEELRAIEFRLQPDYKLLVIDSMTGQESLNVAKAFDQSVGITGSVLTKLDSDTRSGAAFSFCYAIKKPIIFVGIGEKVEDLELFRPERMADRILGMGDVVSLVEKAEEKIAKDEQESLYKSMMKGKLTLEDFAKQMDMVGKIGSLGSLIKYLPGIGGAAIPQDAVEKGEREMKKFRAVISSMTKKERLVPTILDGSRKKRIARGAGVVVADVNLLLKRFEESKQYVKLLKRFGRF